jgi:hypothetical protein
VLNGASVNDPEAIKRPATGRYLGALGTETVVGWVCCRESERDRGVLYRRYPRAPRRDDDDEITSLKFFEG